MNGGLPWQRVSYAEKRFYVTSFSRRSKIVVLHHLVGVQESGNSELDYENTWWRHQMETFSALLAFSARNSSVTDEFPAQWPVTRSLYLPLNKRLIKQPRRRWFETPSRTLLRHCNDFRYTGHQNSAIKRDSYIRIECLYYKAHIRRLYCHVVHVRIQNWGEATDRLRPIEQAWGAKWLART